MAIRISILERYCTHESGTNGCIGKTTAKFFVLERRETLSWEEHTRRRLQFKMLEGLVLYAEVHLGPVALVVHF